MQWVSDSFWGFISCRGAQAHESLAQPSSSTCLFVSHIGVHPKAASTGVLRDELPRKITDLSPFRPKRVDCSWNRTDSTDPKTTGINEYFPVPVKLIPFSVRKDAKVIGGSYKDSLVGQPGPVGDKAA